MAHSENSTLNPEFAKYMMYNLHFLKKHVLIYMEKIRSFKEVLNILIQILK